MDILKPILSDPGFFGLSLLAIFGAFGVIFEKNIVRAGCSLIICFGAVAGTYFALKAPFVGASQILIYAVGIMLVIVFALMLTSQRQDLPKVKDEISRNLVNAVISIGIFATFTYALTGNKWFPSEVVSCPRNTEVIGLKMLGYYVLPFELVSILLLVALIGAIVIAKRDKKGEN